MKRFPKILMATGATASMTAIPETALGNCSGVISGQRGHGQMEYGQTGDNNTGTRISTGHRAGMDRSL